MLAVVYLGSFTSTLFGIFFFFFVLFDFLLLLPLLSFSFFFSTFYFLERKNRMWQKTKETRFSLFRLGGILSVKNGEILFIKQHHVLAPVFRSFGFFFFFFKNFVSLDWINTVTIVHRQRMADTCVAAITMTTNDDDDWLLILFEIVLFFPLAIISCSWVRYLFCFLNHLVLPVSFIFNISRFGRRLQHAEIVIESIEREIF